MADLLAATAAFFLWGLLRGLSTCLFLCAPGMIPILVNEKAGMARSLWLGFLLSLPRILFLTALGALLGFIGFEVLAAAPVHDALWAVSVGAYMFLGMMLVFVGARILDSYGLGLEEDGSDHERKGGRGTTVKGNGRRGQRAVQRGKRKRGDERPGGKECKAPASSRWSRLWMGIAMRLYPGKGKSDGLFLLWGGVLSLACLLDLGLLEGTAASALAGAGTSAAAASAGGGAVLMFYFSMGATVPILVAAATGGGLVATVKSRKRLETIRGVGAMLMVLLGLYFLLAEIYKVLAVLKLL
jgi:cytochrome c biogenesis protein CcdA